MRVQGGRGVFGFGGRRRGGIGERWGILVLGVASHRSGTRISRYVWRWGWAWAWRWRLVKVERELSPEEEEQQEKEEGYGGGQGVVNDFGRASRAVDVQGRIRAGAGVGSMVVVLAVGVVVFRWVSKGACCVVGYEGGWEVCCLDELFELEVEVG